MAMNSLNLKDTLVTCNIIMHEILTSLLNVNSRLDSIALLRTQNHIENTYFNDIPYENSDSCNDRILKNIYSSIKESKSGQMVATYYDYENGRIFQIIHPKITFKPTCDFSIKVYRQDCNSHFINL